MSLFYKQNAAARFFVDQANGKVYEVAGGSAALLCWRNGVKEREKVAELPPGLDDSWEGFVSARDLPRRTTAAFILPGPRDGAASGAECRTPRASSNDGII